MYYLTEADFVQGKSDEDIDECRPTPADELPILVNCWSEAGICCRLISHDAGQSLRIRNLSYGKSTTMLDKKLGNSLPQQNRHLLKHQAPSITIFFLYA